MPDAVLDDATRSLVALAAAIAQGEEPEIRDRIADARQQGVPARWVDELLLQSVLMVGWPRTLIAASLWRAVEPSPAEGAGDDLDYTAHGEWLARGEESCRTIYGDNYRKLRQNVAALHPALDQWMVTEGYGRTLSRPGLPLPLRELCVVAQTAVLDTPRQLHSHLRGSLNAGASMAEVEAALAVVNPFLSYDDFKRVRELWESIRDSWSPLA